MSDQSESIITIMISRRVWKRDYRTARGQTRGGGGGREKGHDSDADDENKRGPRRHKSDKESSVRIGKAGRNNNNNNT